MIRKRFDSRHRRAAREGLRHAGLPLRFIPATMAALLCICTGSLAAQVGGTIVGQVTDARSGEELGAVQVYIAGTSNGTLTNDGGRFILLNVPVGAYTIRAERIGYAPLDREVTVQAGSSVEASFQLVEQALGLDEIVVTGTAGAARRREVGNSMAQINLSEVSEPIASTDALLQGRAAGLTVIQTSGQVGGGAQIRLRGNVSATMSNQPLVYIDGVRVRSEGYPKNRFPIGYAGSSDNTQYSPLNDINPGDIDRVEIVKGPAATTLYGTEAASGVIQIFTKRGRTGSARWTAQTDQTLSRIQKFGPTEGFDGAPLVIPANEVNPYGTPDFMYLEPWLDNGWRQKYNLSVDGGSESLQYYVGGSWHDETGVLPNDWMEQFSVRGNISFTPMEDLQLQWNTGYSRALTKKTPTGGTAEGVTLNAFRRDRNYFNNKDPELIGQVMDFDLRSFVDHIVTGLTAVYSPTSSFTNRFTVGYDLAEQETRALQPFGFFFTPLGRIQDTRWENRTLTLDYVGTYSLDLGTELTTSFSWGGQSVTTEETSTSAMSQNFPGPGDPTVSSGAISLGFESRERVINAGFFVQNVLDFRDRYFLTLGLRVDGNSAFGSNLGLQAYPKISGSYVLSDEDFWNPAVGTVKLRAAYGQSGRAPGAFDAVRTWNPSNLGDLVAFVPNNLGNPDLGPERTSEIEAGFDGSFFEDRLALDFTYYHQTTTDALFGIRQPPSAGGWSSQLENVGKIRNKGIEITTNLAVIRQTDWGWELGATVATNNSETLDLGGATPFSLGNRGWVVEGEPVPVMRGRCVTNPDDVADAEVQADCNIGPNRPTKNFSINTHVRLPAGMSISARGEYQGGNYAYSLMDGESITRGIRWPACFNSYPAIDAGDLSSVTAHERTMCIAANANRDFAIFPMDFFRMRELTFSSPLPFEVPGATSAVIMLSAQNFWMWKKAKYSYLDPETTGAFQIDDQINGQVHTVGGSIPLPAAYTASLRFVF